MSGITSGGTRVECFMLCDGAQECNGKLYVLGGGWTQVYGKVFPLTYRQLSLAVRLSVPWFETNRPQTFRIKLVDEDGQDILPTPFEGEFNVGRPASAEPGDDLPLLWAINMIDITFPRPGGYTVQLLIEGEEKARTRLRARQQ